MKPVTLNEVAHSIFYAPMYVAIEEGYFEEEGIDLDLVCGFGADKTMTAVISGEADIGFMGSESSIYTYNEGANDYVVNFAQLTPVSYTHLDVYKRQVLPPVLGPVTINWSNVSPSDRLMGTTFFGSSRG